MIVNTFHPTSLYELRRGIIHSELFYFNHSDQAFTISNSGGKQDQW